MKVYILVDEWCYGKEAIWHIFKSLEDAKSFLNGFPKEEIDNISIQEFSLYESSDVK